MQDFISIDARKSCATYFRTFTYLQAGKHPHFAGVSHSEDLLAKLSTQGSKNNIIFSYQDSSDKTTSIYLL
jgi:hypothetical protein